MKPSADELLTEHILEAMNSGKETTIALDAPLTIPAGEYRIREIAELLNEAMLEAK